MLNRIYYLLRWKINFLEPAMKLKSKTRHGAKTHRVYDSAQTPYRVLKLRDIKRNEDGRTQDNL